MKYAFTMAAVAVCAWAGVAAAQSGQGAQPASSGAGEVYHVHFNKATPGQAAALGDRLRTPDPKAPMPGHMLVLRHQEGDDWDYCVIEHLGAKATVDTSPSTVPPAMRDQSAWHTDTFASGPAWPEFVRAMGLDPSGAAGSPIYIVGVQRAVPGHRDQLEKVLNAPTAGKVQTGNVMLQHLEGGPWNFLTITRYNSWADLASDRTAAAAGGGSQWNEIRVHSAWHHDTIADRLNVAAAAGQKQ